MDIDERAVSPTIGVVLLVAIGVTIAAGVAAVSLGLTDELDGTEPEEVAEYPGTATATPTGETTNAVTSRNPTAGATDTRNVVRVAIPESGSNAAGSSLSGLDVAYPSGFDASGLTTDDVLVVGVDEDGDGTLDSELTGDLSGVRVTDDGQTVELTFGGNSGLNTGDTVVAELDGIDNPASAGEYDVTVEINDGEETAAGTVTID